MPFRDLLAVVERARIVPFVGAGMSKPMGMPLWGEALKELLGRLPGADAAAINAQIDAGHYLGAAQALVDHDDVQTTNFVRTKYRIQKIKLGGPMVLLPRIAKGCVVTTNFDDAIEETYRGVNVEFKATCTERRSTTSSRVRCAATTACSSCTATRTTPPPIS